MPQRSVQLVTLQLSVPLLLPHLCPQETKNHKLKRSRLQTDKIILGQCWGWDGEMRHILLRPEPSVSCLQDCVCPLGLRAGGWNPNLHWVLLLAPSTLVHEDARHHGEEAQEGDSIPRVSTVLLVVEL